MIDTNEEVRDGYLVTEKTKKIWNIELGLLKELLRICEKYELTCWVIAGTMLGAVRHKGFIPWDDDIDVALPRKDFEKLKEVAPNEFKHPYFLQTPYSDKYYYSPTIRLRNSESTGIITQDKMRKTNNGIFIDIFPMDAWPEDLKKQKTLIRYTRVYNKLLYDRHYLTPDSVKNKLFYCINKLVFLFYPYEKLLKKFDKHCSKYNDKNLNMIAYVARGKVKNEGFRYAWTKEEIADTVYLDFENMQVPVPGGYLSCLKKRYGNYMKFPPIEERGKWHEDIIIFEPDIPYKEYQKKQGWV